MLSQVRDRWFQGDLISGISFSLNDTAVITGGPRAGEAVAVISLEALEPEPIYLVEVLSGQGDLLQPQSALRLHVDRSVQQHDGADADHVSANPHSSQHREKVLASTQCGCFYCLAVFSPNEIREWVDAGATGQGQTALCPICGIDSVLPDRAGIPLTLDSLTRMREHWFGPGA